MMSADNAFALPSSMWQIRTPSRCSVVTAADDIRRSYSPTGRTTTPDVGHQRLRLGDRVLLEVEDRRGEHGVGPTEHDAVDEVIERADATAGDHRHGHRVGDRPGQFEVEALPRAVAIHRREQDLAGAAGDGVAAHSTASMPVGVRPPCRYTSHELGRRRRPVRPAAASHRSRTPRTAHRTRRRSP